MSALDGGTRFATIALASLFGLVLLGRRRRRQRRIDR
jgi:MYXO-CTERM domain-containing protein